MLCPSFGGGDTMKQQRWRRLEPVEMRQRRHNYFPHVFAWRGQEYHVDAVERCWTISHCVRIGWVEGHCFRVRARPNVRLSGHAQSSQASVFDLFQDAQTGIWHMQRQVR